MIFPAPEEDCIMMSFMTCIFSDYNKNDQVKEDEMDRACNMNERGRIYIGYWWESQKERDHWEDQDVGVWTILKLILER
jgi:hypothetical protein